MDIKLLALGGTHLKIERNRNVKIFLVENQILVVL